MPAITSSQVAYALVSSTISGPGRVKRVYTLTFPTSASTSYATGGVPLDLQKLGIRPGGSVLSLRVLGRTPTSGNENPVYEWNGSATAPTLVAFETATAGSPAAQFDNATNYTQNGQVVTIEVEGA